MESKAIECDTFRAVFGTQGVSYQGQCNIYHHAKQCGSCFEWAEEKRVEEISCQYCQELAASPFSPAEVLMLRKHMKHCFSLKCYDNPTYERRVLNLLLGGAFGWTPKEGESVRITDGPFVNFTGTIVKIDTEDFFVAVQANVFGRKTDIIVKPSFIERYQEEME